MADRNNSIHLSTFLNLAVSIIFVAAAVAIIFIFRTSMHQQARIEAESKAKILMDRTLATHDYFTNTLKPAIFSLTKGHIPPDHFDPTWMSSTYANRFIDLYFLEKSETEYYFKNCAINARTVANEANQYERQFIKDLNIDPTLMVRSYIKEFKGEPYLVVLRRGETMREACLRCHSTPERAPKGLVDIYGPNRSFNRTLGEVISAQSIRIPLAAAYANADQLAWSLSGVLLLVLAGIFLAQLFIYRQFLTGPLDKIKNKAVQITEAEEHLGEEIELPTGRELQDLVHAFNHMSVNLRHQRDNLETNVQERTRELQQALDNIKTLKGMLPICASCKKIRDDEGYWNQIESYLLKHSDAEFSHSICPDCVKTLYPELADDDEKASDQD